MSAEVLHQAATLMRERAEAASPGPWHVCDSPEWHEDALPDQVICAEEHLAVATLADEWYEDQDGEPASADDARHIASWHPAVALAVADWLDATAAENDSTDALEFLNFVGPDALAAVKVARAYLGEPPP